jgi:hypothetical protein
MTTTKSREPRVKTLPYRKPTLSARVLHISINNRAWLHDAMIKPLKVGGKKNG